MVVSSLVLQVRLTRPAALTALCAPWRRIRADEVLRRRRVLRQHHGREPRRDRSSAADSRAQVRARSPVCLWAHSAARVVAEGACGDLLRCRCPLALAGEVSGSGGARTPRRHMQLSAAAAATRRAPGAPAAAAPHAGASAPGSSIRLLARQARVIVLGCSAAAGPPGHRARSPWAPESATGECVGPCALKEAPVCFMAPFYAPVCGPVRMSVRVEGWKRCQRLKLAWQARLGPVCVACKFGRVAPPSRVYVAGAPRPPVRVPEQRSVPWCVSVAVRRKSEYLCVEANRTTHPHPAAYA